MQGITLFRRWGDDKMTNEKNKEIGKKIKGIDSLIGAFSILDAMKTLALGGSLEERKDVFRTEENGWVVDTCIGFDTGVWETGILPKSDGNWFIVSQYENKEEAKKGHEKYVELMRENPNREFKDINVWEP